MEKSILNSILALCLLALKAVVDPEANKFLKLAIATYGKKKQKRGGSKSGPTERALEATVSLVLLSFLKVLFNLLWYSHTHCKCETVTILVFSHESVPSVL